MVLKTPEQLLRLPLRETIQYRVFPTPKHIVYFDTRCPNRLTQLATEFVPSDGRFMHARIPHRGAVTPINFGDVETQLGIFYKEITDYKTLSFSSLLERVGLAEYVGLRGTRLFAAFGTFFISLGQGGAGYCRNDGWGMTQRPRPKTEIRRSRILVRPHE